MPFIADIRPVFGYGLVNPKIKLIDGGIIFRNPKSEEGLELMIRGRYKNLPEEGRIKLGKGEGYLLLLYSKDLKYGLSKNMGPSRLCPYEALRGALRYWNTEVKTAKRVNYFIEGYSRSIAVLLGMIYLQSGGIIAAPTTSLPEIIGEGRNWDYRYVWIRDASYAAEALADAGLFSKARRILDFLIGIAESSSRPFNHPLSSVDGTQPIAEKSLDWLRGHKNSRPVRIGNQAYMQDQMDSEGDFINALYCYYKNSRDKGYLKENWPTVESITR